MSAKLRAVVQGAAVAAAPDGRKRCLIASCDVEPDVGLEHCWRHHQRGRALIASVDQARPTRRRRGHLAAFRVDRTGARRALPLAQRHEALEAAGEGSR